MARPLSTIKDLAEEFQVSTDTVRRWAESHRITSYKLGPGILRFDPDQVRSELGLPVPA